MMSRLRTHRLSTQCSRCKDLRRIRRLTSAATVFRIREEQHGASTCLRLSEKRLIYQASDAAKKLWTSSGSSPAGRALAWTWTKQTSPQRQESKRARSVTRKVVTLGRKS